MRSLQESSRLGCSFLPRKHRAAIYRASVLTESQSSFGRGSTCGLRSGGGERSRYRNWLLQTVGGVQTCHRSRDFLEVSLKVVSQGRSTIVGCHIWSTNTSRETKRNHWRQWRHSKTNHKVTVTERSILITVTGAGIVNV